MTLFFDATRATKGTELFKLGNELGADGSVALWADINPGTQGPVPNNFTAFG